MAGPVGCGGPIGGIVGCVFPGGWRIGSCIGIGSTDRGRSYGLMTKGDAFSGASWNKVVGCMVDAGVLGIIGAVTELNSTDAPSGCFQATFDDGKLSPVFYNHDITGLRSHNRLFAKAICSIHNGAAACYSMKHCRSAHDNAEYLCRFRLGSLQVGDT